MISQVQRHLRPMDYKIDSKLVTGSSSNNSNINGNGKVGNGNESGSTGSGSNKKQKSIPLELTAYGTTPSGKPRLFVCQICTRAFARLEHLRRHERSHTKEKPFSCGVCQRKFSRRDLLLRHAQKLHAGCADAITRLRRKSIKRSNSSTSNDLDEEALNTPVKSEVTSDPSPQFKRNDPVQFNLNLFGSQSTSSPSHPSAKKTSRANSIKDVSNSSNLQRQVFDMKKVTRYRGASFSAQSGANYAIGLPEFNDMYPGADNIEFSTPQLLPSTVNDEQSWLNNLSTIPGMNCNSNKSTNGRSNNDIKLNSSLASDELRQNSISSLNLDNNIPSTISHSASISHNNLNSTNMRSDSLASNTSSFNTFDSLNNLQYMMPNATISNNEISNLKNDQSVDDYGYSFYDIPESMLSKPINNQLHLANPLTPIRQEMEDELSQDDSNNTKNGSNNHNNNFDLNFLNDMDEITHEINVSSNFLPNGYSFYGDNPSASSSGIETNSPSMVSPVSTNIQYPPSISQFNENVINHPQLLNIENDLRKKNAAKLSNYTKNKLFTNNIRYMINKSLSKYPISGIMTPTIPSNEKLEFYLNNFINVFLSHFPFIHISKLNEYEIMNMTSNEDISNESARVCLPLLVATIGALLTNNKNDSEHLYEASRRTIHIYLESRKNSVESSSSSSQSINPLWLIQSLTLSVIYGLFSDSENNVYIVIRQLNALNSLVKTSIKSDRLILFSINGEDEENFYKLNQQQQNDSLFSNFNINDEIKFKNNINLQSQIRIGFMIYRLTNFLLMMYNVPLTLSINDLGNLSSPNKNDEFLWNFKSYQNFKEYNQLNHSNKTLDDYLVNDDRIIFKDVLLQLTKSDFNNDNYLINKLDNLSKFGFISIIHGLFEIKQYQEMKNIDIFSILDNLTGFVRSNSTINHYSKIQQDFEKLDYALLVNFIKINSIIDFKLVKEQSWLKNFDELTKNFNKILMNIDHINGIDYLKIIDCCIIIIKLILFKTDDASENKELNTNNGGLFNNDFNFLNNNGNHELFKQSTDDDFNNLINESLTGNTSSLFEKMINLKVFDELDNSKNSIHSQMLFHIFTILSIYSIYIIKRNNGDEQQHQEPVLNNELNQRFKIIINLLNKVENFLKVKYNNNSNLKLETDFTNLYLYSSSSDYFTLEKTLYILKIGELVLSYMYDTNICIFKKLATSLSQIRKFLIDNETRILGG